jgi:LacI family transcriptional regulator
MARYRVDIVTRNDPFFTAQIYRGIAGYARQHGHWELVSHTHDDPELTQRLARGESDGVILEIKTPQMVRALRRKRTHVVNVTSSTPHRDFASVSLDQEAIGRMGARHLIDIGYECLAFAGRDEPWSRMREAGFLAAAAEAGVRTMVLRPGGDQPDARYDWTQVMRTDMLRRWIADLPRPTAVMACEDGVAKRFAEEALIVGASVPEDFAVLGVNNHELSCEYSQTPLSSIDPGSEKLGYAAAEVLDQLLSGQTPDPFHRRVAPLQVVARQSTERLAFRDADFNDALRYIRLHAHEGIDVDDVLQRVPLSRRSLYRRFQEHLGHSPGDEIRRVRLERAQQLLRDTHLSLIEVAIESGYADLSHLSRSFKRSFGLAPGQYRRRHKGA